MNEPDFWKRLEFRVCREFAGLADETLQQFWCDGFIPDTFEVRNSGALIRGRVWIGLGNGAQQAWDFILLAGRTLRSREEIEWDRLLPDEEVTGWLFVDASQKFMKINPSAAYPDRQPV